jgi:hypothetical protein
LVTNGVESAWRRPHLSPAMAWSATAAADIVQQRVNASPLDEIVINLVAVLLGGGIRAAARWSTAARGCGSILVFGFAGEWLIGGVALHT